MKKLLSRHISVHIGYLIFAACIVCLIIGFGSYRYYSLYKELQATRLDFLSKTHELEKSLADAQVELASTTDEKIHLNDVLVITQARTQTFENQIEQISQTVGALDKLSKTDQELLKKYSKVYFLNENYVPEQLSFVSDQFLYSTTKPVQAHTKVIPYLTAMIQKASADGVTLQVLSGYRSFGTQATLKAGYTFVYGAGTANQFSADQGYSEHQLGTTFDFTVPSLHGGLVGFDKTTAYAWLRDNAYAFGFVLSYPQENTYYEFEPWHWRFVGVALATRLHADGKYFYGMDQRDINQYLVNIFD